MWIKYFDNYKTIYSFCQFYLWAELQGWVCLAYKWVINYDSFWQVCSQGNEILVFGHESENPNLVHVRAPYTVKYLKQWDPLYNVGVCLLHKNKLFPLKLLQWKSLHWKKSCNIFCCITFPYRLPLLQQIPLVEEFQFLVHHQLVLDWNC